MNPFPFSVGERVTGRDCGGAAIDACVVECCSPYMVLLDDGKYTPVSLLDRAVLSLEDALA